MNIALLTRRFVPVILTTLIYTGQLLADSEQPGSQQHAKQLQTLLAPMRSLSGAFKQTQTDKNGLLIQQSSGTFTIQRPGKFHWQTDAPFPQLLVSDQQTLWLYDPDLEQVTIRPVDQRLQQTPVLLFTDDLSALASAFEITRNEQEAFTLSPTSTDQLFEAITLHFDGERLTDMQLLDGLGQTTRFQLLDVQLNPPVDASLFQFQVPEGTDVLIDES